MIKANIILDKKTANYVAINPDINFPEINHRNNWENISNRFGFKKIDFKFVKDLENPSKNQIFFNPITDFNAYDGLIFGVRFHNKTFKNRPFEVEKAILTSKGSVFSRVGPPKKVEHRGFWELF